MKFKITKEYDGFQTWYWTKPKNILYLIHEIIFGFALSNQTAYSCWESKEKAIRHVKRWNSGYYKKKYKEKVIRRCIE